MYILTVFDNFNETALTFNSFCYIIVIGEVSSMIGNTLKKLRTNKGLTLQQMGEILEVSHMTYQRYEKNNCDVSTDMLAKIADFYGVTTDYLLGRETAPEQETLTSLNLTEKEKAFIRTYAELNPEKRSCFIEVLSNLSKIM